MLEDVVNGGFIDDSKRTLLKDILNPTTHGDALVSAMRIGSATAQGRNWAQYLSRPMTELTHNFVVLIRELAGIDLEAVAGKHVASVPQD